MDDPRAIAEVIAERTRSQVVHVIGKKIVLYKENMTVKELADNLLKNGFNVDTKEYYPHITIIRKPENVNSIALNNINKNLNIISKVTEITLFESTRINGRLQYIKL